MISQNSQKYINVRWYCFLCFVEVSSKEMGWNGRNVFVHIALSYSTR